MLSNVQIFRRISVFWKVDTRSCFFFLLEKQSVVYPIKHDWDDETYCAKWGMWIEHLDFVFFFSLKMGRKRKYCQRHNRVPLINQLPSSHNFINQCKKWWLVNPKFAFFLAKLANAVNSRVRHNLQTAI